MTGRRDAQQAPASPPARLRDRLHSHRGRNSLISGAVVGTLSLWVAGVFGDLGGRTVDLLLGDDPPPAATPSSVTSHAPGPPASSSPPPDLDLVTLPPGTLSQQVAAGYGIMVPRPLADVDRPPPRGDAAVPPADAAFDGWLTDVGGVHADSTSVEVAATYAADDPVLITGVRPVVVERRPAIEGTHVLPMGGEGTSIRLLAFDLDASPPVLEAQENPVTGKPWRFPLRVARGVDEFFLVLGRTQSHTVTWYLELDYVLQGEARTLRIDDDGEPFRTSGTSRAREMSYFPDADQPWPMVEPVF